MAEIVFLILAIVLMMIGLAGVVLPFVPGVPLVWAGLCLYGAATGFEAVSLPVVLIFLGLTILLTALDLLAPLWGAKKYRASKWGVIGAFLGTVVGIFVLGVPGIILGPLVGALVGELMAGRGKKQAFRLALGTLVGFILGTLIRLIVVLIMFGFLIASFF